MSDVVQSKANIIWPLAELLRGGWKQHEYQDVILPMVLIRRIDTVLEPTRSEVRSKYRQFAGKTDVDPILRRVAGVDFYNTSEYDFKTLLDEPSQIAKNFQRYIDGFSANVREIIDKFEFDRQLERLEGGNILYEIIKQLNSVDLSPDAVDNHEMGTIFEDLLRRFSEQSNETAGEHYTPRDVVTLLAELLVEPDKAELSKPYAARRIYDPTAGTGGILSITKEIIKKEINPKADIYLYGQELNPQTYAIAKADMLLKGENANNIRGGDKDASKASTLSNDQFFGESFEYIAANPPYGVDWKKDKAAVEREADRGYAGRFGAGTPRISDGQLLFVQHMISKMQAKVDGGARVGVVLNGSPLFTGSAGSGESEIRRWILEKDLLEAIIALPDQLFYNTGISTYIWILSNRKSEERRRKVQLIDARKQYGKMRKSLGNKRKEIKLQDRQQILKWYREFKEGSRVKIFDTEEFGYRQITIERPLQLSLTVTDDAISSFTQHKLVAGQPPKKAPAFSPEYTDEIVGVLRQLRGKKYMSCRLFLGSIDKAMRKYRLDTKMVKLLCEVFGAHDDDAEAVTDNKGRSEPDSSLRDTENVPLGESIQEYFGREVSPYMPGAWINTKVTDHKDGGLGKVGYEIPFTRYFYEYKSPRDIDEIRADIEATEKELVRLFKELRG
ncbi:type I restriction-modification system subunit M [Candidatus Nanoperiomorbus periodonticus]|uniref:type I restriction-modification system subunit M n=1 Tax=Candidatus Nanoperiomorbus periodonticus TaxID=2171989 RepID=UPI00101CAFE5|nr:class I SAM-dependent DNA methyltransferase [Candidatus Nanoperiomorbus periodonticus]RYC76007.1 Type I restriction enzyme EcoKI M protein [Candidatus Nanoperiomorbus periodonticus]